MPRTKAVLLIGPTGAGKSPMGELMSVRGLDGRRCIHFDFGATLRAAAADGPGNGLTDSEAEFIREVLARGALLENESFYLAEKLLRSFLTRQAVRPDDLIILNGLPRHVGQAMAVDRIVNVRMILHFVCSPETVLERLRRNSGGDRTGRLDDDPALVRKKLEVFEGRTRPLIDHYRTYGAEIVGVMVSADSRAEDLYPTLSGRWPED